jgi:hypothetical protein
MEDKHDRGKKAYGEDREDSLPIEASGKAGISDDLLFFQEALFNHMESV